MKRIILSLIFILAMININASNNVSDTFKFGEEVIFISQKTIEIPTYLEVMYIRTPQSSETQSDEAFSCLKDAYEWANKKEKESFFGQYGWTFEQWNAVFQHYFAICNYLQYEE